MRIDQPRAAQPKAPRGTRPRSAARTVGVREQLHFGAAPTLTGGQPVTHGTQILSR